MSHLSEPDADRQLAEGAEPDYPVCKACGDPMDLDDPNPLCARCEDDEIAARLDAEWRRGA